MKRNLIAFAAILFVIARFLFPESVLEIAGVVLFTGTSLIIYFGYYFSWDAIRLYISKKARLERTELLLSDKTGRIDFNTDEISSAIGIIRSVLIENDGKDGMTILNQHARQEIDSQIDIIIVAAWRLRHPPK